MFCPKCGTQNPEAGKFCRSCGTDLGTISEALSGKLNPRSSRKDPVGWDGEKVSWEGALSKCFIGAAFLIISIILGFTGRGSGWWFWLLIPAFGLIGTGLAQIVHLKKTEQKGAAFSSATGREISGGEQASLPSMQTEYVAPETRYKTGDAVPPSVTVGTTRHLEINSEGETMTLPKK